MKVNFLDLKKQYESIKTDIDEAIKKVIDRTAFAGGPFVQQFEEEFASYCGTAHAVGVGSGTEALWLALLALDIGQGDEVITIPNTFIATAEAISFAGATPIFVDIDRKTFTMDPAKIEEAITPKTKAIIPVQLFGQMSDMDPIMDIAKKHNLHVIEDACQAHGAEYKGKRAGSIGIMGAFSFYPGKNLGAYGEGGGITTNNKELADKCKMLRDHGQSKKYYHSLVGWNARLDGIQGAILSAKLKHLDTWNASRRANAQLYRDLMKDVSGIELPVEADYGKHVYHIFAIMTENRTAFMDYLKEKEVYCGIHYPVPLHKQEAYKDTECAKKTYPVAEECSAKFVSLPMGEHLEKEHIEFVNTVVREYFS
jgi:dTDP-4-amino-4,6-dideoxygalactose transaminase